MRKEIENRLIELSVEVINLSKSMGNEFVGSHFPENSDVSPKSKIGHRKSTIN